VYNKFPRKEDILGINKSFIFCAKNTDTKKKENILNMYKININNEYL